MSGDIQQENEAAAVEPEAVLPTRGDDSVEVDVPSRLKEEAALEQEEEGSVQSKTTTRKRRPRAPVPPPGSEATDLSVADAERFDFDSWVHKWDWETPGMKFKVARRAPASRNGVNLAGLLTEQSNQPMSESEIKDQFGGGTYEISVIGPRWDKKQECHRIMRLSHKTLQISGEPRMDFSNVLPDDRSPTRLSTERGVGTPIGPMPPPPPPDPTHSLLRDAFTDMRRERVSAQGESVKTIQTIGSQYERANQISREGMDRILAEKDAVVQMKIKSADDKVDEARAEIELARSEKDKAMREVMEMKDKMEQQRSAIVNDFQSRLQDATAGSNTLLSTLLPQAQQSAQQQIQMMTQVFENRLSQAEKSYQSRLETLERAHEDRIRAQQDFYKTQIEGSKQLWGGQIQMLQLQLQQSQEENRRLNTELDSTRNRLMEEIHRQNKQNNPQHQLMQMAGVIETVKQLDIGGREKDEDDTPKTGNAMFDTIMQNLGKLADGIPHIAQAWSAKSQADQIQMMRAQGGMPRQVMPQQQLQAAPPQMQQQQHPQQHPQRQAPQQPPPQQMRPQQPARRRPRPAPTPTPPQKQKPPGGGKLNREDMEQAIGQINATLESNPQIEVEAFATMAIATVPNDLLRKISRQDSKLVVGELERKEFLKGKVATDEGKEFLCKLLDQLREKL